MSQGVRSLAILSESLGYHNLIGRWGAITTAKVKGITGDVILATAEGNRRLVGNGVSWASSPGLNGAANGSCQKNRVEQRESKRARWSTATFRTPVYDPKTFSLFLNITKGRGHFWLNGHNLSRFWDIKRGRTKKQSQQFYFLPFDYLVQDDLVDNKIVFFDALGNNLSPTQLVLTWLEKTASPSFRDDIDFPEACI